MNARITRRLCAGVALAGALCLLATGCKGGASSSGTAAKTASASSSTSSSKSVFPSASVAPPSTPETPRVVGTIPKTCPTAAQVSSAIGFTVPAPLASSDSGSLSCTYATGGADDVEINFQTTPPGTTAAGLEAQLTSDAASGTKVRAVSGYGQAAFTSTTSGGGVGMLVLDSSVEISIVGGTSMPGLAALTKTILAG
jgi:hypothetical protein